MIGTLQKIQNRLWVVLVQDPGLDIYNSSCRNWLWILVLFIKDLLGFDHSGKENLPLRSSYINMYIVHPVP